MPAILTGSGAALQQDAAATVTGTANTSGYTVPAGGATLVINGVSISLTAGETPSQIATDITGAAGDGIASATIGSNGELTLTSTDASTAIDIGSGSTASLLTALGLNVGTTEPTNLLTQNAVASGQTMIIQFGSQAATTLTFGTGAGDIQTEAQLANALSTGLTGGTGSLDANGDLKLTATSTSDGIAVTGSATPSVFGLQLTSALPPNGTVSGSDVNTFLNQSVGGGAITAYNNAGSPVNVQFRWAKVDDFEPRRRALRHLESLL